jgi:peroxiredoxin Q/BCP
MSQMPAIGDAAPSLCGPTDRGDFDLSAHAGEMVVVYFYPKDMTPGCTVEAQDFRDRVDAFAAAGATIVGVSKDAAKRHAKFREKECLPFDLLSDAEGTVCEDWGVWQEKKNYGRTYMGIVRSTFLVDKDGTVVASWPKVRVKGHVDVVLAAVQAL